VSPARRLIERLTSSAMQLRNCEGVPQLEPAFAATTPLKLDWAASSNWDAVTPARVTVDCTVACVDATVGRTEGATEGAPAVPESEVGAPVEEAVGEDAPAVGIAVGVVVGTQVWPTSVGGWVGAAVGCVGAAVGDAVGGDVGAHCAVPIVYTAVMTGAAEVPIESNVWPPALVLVPNANPAG